MPTTARLKRTLGRIQILLLRITEQEMNRSLKVIARDPAVKINKKLSTHSGRRTFAATMCAERGISCETCATMMGITIAVCEKSYYRVNATEDR